jgi:hypothetical protein
MSIGVVSRRRQATGVDVGVSRRHADLARAGRTVRGVCVRCVADHGQEERRRYRRALGGVSLYDSGARLIRSW